MSTGLNQRELLNVSTGVIVDYVSTEYCRICRAMLESRDSGPATLCPTCWSVMDGYSPSVDCVEGLTIISAAPYDEPVRTLIHGLKFEKDMLISEDLTTLLERAWVGLLQSNRMESVPYLVPVPMHWTRMCARGFNQSELLAGSLAWKHGLDMKPTLVRRKRITRPQYGLTREARMTNVSAAFSFSDTQFGVKLSIDYQRSIVLVDDVLTSGATLIQCANVLRGAGFRAVAAISVARA